MHSKCREKMMTSTGSDLLQERCLGSSLLCSSMHRSGEAAGDLAVRAEHWAANCLS